MTCTNDGAFGPIVRGCRDDFDFTRRFELLLFSIIPESIIIALCAVRLILLYQRKRVVSGIVLQWSKLVRTVCLGSNLGNPNKQTNLCFSDCFNRLFWPEMLAPHYRKHRRIRPEQVVDNHQHKSCACCLFVSHPAILSRTHQSHETICNNWNLLIR